jgi:hypothetical protein
MLHPEPDLGRRNPIRVEGGFVGRNPAGALRFSERSDHVREHINFARSRGRILRHASRGMVATPAATAALRNTRRETGNVLESRLAARFAKTILVMLY